MGVTAHQAPDSTTTRRGPERLKRRAEFAAVMRNGRRARHPLFQLVALRTEGPHTRIGFSAGKHIGGAVVRNRLKRRLRMIVRDLPWRPGYDVVIVGRPEAASATYSELASAAESIAAKQRLLEPANA